MRQGRPPQAGSIVTLTTDFGLRDAYVAQMKANLLRYCPDVRLIDVTHEVPAQDVLFGSIALERAVDAFPPGTIHLAVVDPGVGTARRLLVVQIRKQIIVCPDNGLITWTWRRHSSDAAAHELTWRPRKSSTTFHGRDVLAPICGRLACGARISHFSRPIDNPILLDVAPAARDSRQGRVIHIDRFGNATTNIAGGMMRRSDERTIRLKRRAIGKLRTTYSDVAPGKPLALVGSSGLIEIAVRDGSAALHLRLRVGDDVYVS